MFNDTALIKEVLSRYNCMEAEAMHRALQNIAPPSDEFFDELDKRVADIKQIKGRGLTLKKALTVLIAATMIIAILAVSVYAVSERLNIGGFFVEWFEGYSKMSPSNQIDDSISAENVVIDYLPEDCTVLTYDISKEDGFCRWLLNDGSITLHFSTVDENDHYHLNTENNECTVITIGEKVVYRTKYPTQVNALWSDEKMVYYLSCVNLSWDEMVKIIEGISYIEE